MIKFVKTKVLLKKRISTPVFIAGVAGTIGMSLLALNPVVQPPIEEDLTVRMAITGNVYYVDSGAGNDNNAGTLASPWKTLNKVNYTVFNPGDSILLKRGGQWQEMLVPSSSGSSGAPITYDAYGTGDNPVITGGTVLGNWQSAGANKYSTTLSLRPEMLFFNNMLGTAVSSVGNLSAANQWFWQNNVLTVYSLTLPVNVEATIHQYYTIANWSNISGTKIYTASVPKPIEMIFINGQAGTSAGSLDNLNANGKYFYDWSSGNLSVYFDLVPTASTVVEAYAFQNLINVQQKNYLVIQNLTLRHGSAGLQGIVSLADTKYVTLNNLVISDSVSLAGVAISAYSGALTGNNTVSNSQIYNIKGSRVSKAFGSSLNGIGLSIAGPDNTSLTKYNQILTNTIYNSGTYNISLSASSNNIISGNTVYNGGWAGINFSGGPQIISSGTGTGNTVEYNTVYGNCQVKDDCAGINAFRVGDNNVIRYNLVHDQHDTINDGSILPSIGKLGTVGIRFDGTYYSPGPPPVYDYFTASTGNRAYYNIIYNEYEGFQIYNFNNVDLANNTVYNTTYAGLMLMSDNPVNKYINNTIVKNNIFDSNSGYLIYDSYTQQSNFDNNIYFPDGPTKFYWQDVGANGISSNFSGWSSHGQDVHSISNNPLFVDSAAKNFRLQTGSPGINKGVSLNLTSDFEKTTVPQGSAPDVGAYEYISTCLPQTCAILGKACGLWPNGCGETVNCGLTLQDCTVFFGTCLVGGTQGCTSDGQYGSCSATDPRIANCSGKQCGDDGCGGVCGACQTGQTCVSGVCQVNCTPKTCSQLSPACGSSLSDGCGGMISCTSCGAGKICESGQCCTASYTYYRDADVDGYGSSTLIKSCKSTPPSRYVKNNKDCNDSYKTTKYCSWCYSRYCHK